MFAYDAKSQKFFSSKFFSAHINTVAATDEGGMGTYGEDWSFYLDNLLGPVAAPAKRLLDRIGIIIVEEDKVPEGVTTAFEKECVACFSMSFAYDPSCGWMMHASRLPETSASRHARLRVARTGALVRLSAERSSAAHTRHREVGLTGLETGWLVNLFRSASKAAPRARGSQAAAAAEAAEAAAAAAPAAEATATITGGKLAVASICPRHGPVVINSITELVEAYQEVLTERLEKKEDVTVGVIFASAYGACRALLSRIRTIARSLRSHAREALATRFDARPGQRIRCREASRRRRC